jgi:general secretion pathway protein A
MYESHFGLSAPPFQLSPDHAFYFDSRGHHTALAYMRYGLHGGEGFIVVTGEVGAGKTTLVRTLLNEIDPAKVVSAHIVSTQLDTDNLLMAILVAFGVRRTGAGKAQMMATLEAFLVQLAAQGRRALLIVDEAQNLSAQAVEELRMLSNFQIETQTLLQSFLIGQPELQRVLRSAAMEQFRQRITASCHLGPLDPAETRPYVEHRLRTVGWKQRPAFAAPCFERIHERTGGIPRAINRLCHRLMLAAYLGNRDTIEPVLVDEAGDELQKELGLTPRPLGTAAGDAAAAHPAASMSASKAPTAVGPGAQGDAAGAVRAARPAIAPVVVASAPVDPGVVDLWADGGDAGLGGFALCLACTTAERLKAGALAEAFAVSAQLPPVLVAHAGEGFADLELAGRLVGLPLPSQALNLGMEVTGAGPTFAPLIHRVAQVLRGRRPSVVIVFGASDLATAGLLLARKLGLATLRLCGPQRAPLAGDTPLNQALAEVLAEHAMAEAGTTSTESAGHTAATGLMADVLAPLQQRWPADADLLGALRLPDELIRNRGGYVLATHLDTDQAHGAAALERWIEPLSALGRRTPVLWVAPAAQAGALRASGWLRRLADVQVHVLPEIGYVQGLRLLRDAAALLTHGSREWAEEAETFGVPRIDHAGLHKALLLGPRSRGSIEALVDPRERAARGLVTVRPSGAGGRVAQQFERLFVRPAVAPARG